MNVEVAPRLVRVQPSVQSLALQKQSKTNLNFWLSLQAPVKHFSSCLCGCRGQHQALHVESRRPAMESVARHHFS